MGTMNYFGIEGSLYGQRDFGAGGIRSFARDGLGDVVATIDGTTGGVENSYRYQPYGGQLSKSGAGQDPSFKWIGVLGYRNTNLTFADSYVRSRHYSSAQGQWTTIDPYFPSEPQYVYSFGNPSTLVDWTGESAFSCERCGLLLYELYRAHEVHHCCHPFIHCLVCCILNHEFDADCAKHVQSLQNQHDPGDPGTGSLRSGWCKAGIEGNVETSKCADHCKKLFKCAQNGKDCTKVPDEGPYWPWGGHLPTVCYNCSPVMKVWSYLPSWPPFP